MELLLFSKFASMQGIDYNALDKCIKAIFHILSFKKYGKTDYLLISVDSEKSILEVVDKNTGINVFSNFGRRAICAARVSLDELIDVFKNRPNDFETLYRLAIENEVEKYFCLLRAIKPRVARKYGLEQNWLDTYDIDENSVYDSISGRFCSACESAPCMCSDPERTSTTCDF